MANTPQVSDSPRARSAHTRRWIVLITLVVALVAVVLAFTSGGPKSDGERLADAKQRISEWNSAYQVAKGDVVQEFLSVADCDIMIDRAGEVLRGSTWHVMHVRDGVSEDELRSLAGRGGDKEIVGYVGDGWWMYRWR